jgi:malonyl-CoA O-methyltransferase
MQQSVSTTSQYKLAIARNFSRAAHTYDQAALLQQEIGHRLLERLRIIKFSPTTILDLGSGTGVFSKALSQNYPTAIVLNADIAEGMVNFAKRTYHAVDQRYLCADGDYLPIKSQSIDLVFSNCVLHWFLTPQTVFKEIHRVLKPEGLLLFSTFGPDTLKELKACFKMLDGTEHVNTFIDMHDIGDLILQEALLDPVMDMETITLTYKSLADLLQDLKRTGSHYVHRSRIKRQGLFTRARFNQLFTAYEKYKDKAQKLPATFEVIYGHAWTNQYAIDQDRKIALTLEF